MVLSGGVCVARQGTPTRERERLNELTEGPGPCAAGMPPWARPAFPCRFEFGKTHLLSGTGNERGSLPESVFAGGGAPVSRKSLRPRGLCDINSGLSRVRCPATGRRERWRFGRADGDI